MALASSICADAIKKLEYLSIVTWIYLNLPNSALWVISICHKELKSRSQRLTPRYGAGKYCGHISHCLAVWWAISVVYPNCFFKFLLFWWYKKCDHWVSSTKWSQLKHYL